MALVPGHHVHLVALDLTAERHLGLAPDDALTELGGHHLGVIGVDVQLLGDLLVGEVQPHEVQAQDPDPQRLMMAGEDRIGQVVEPLTAAVAVVALTFGLGVVPAVLGDPVGATPGAPHAIGPAHRPDGLEALGVVDEGLDVDHRRASLGPVLGSQRSGFRAEFIPKTTPLEPPPWNPG